MSNAVVLFNGQPAKNEAVLFSLADSDVMYGYGCYEVLKVRGGLLYFPEFHAERFLRSAEILGIAHTLKDSAVVAALNRFVSLSGENECNIKMMLIGHDSHPADWYIFSVPAIHPPTGAAAFGVPCLVYYGERHFPQAKSLSMLLSTVAYRSAASSGCYDALLVNRRGEITEGTRTNVFFTYLDNPRRVHTPPSIDVLSGITRKTFLAALEENGWKCGEKPLLLEDVLAGKCSLLVSSTSTRLVPVNRLLVPDAVIKEEALPICPELHEAAGLYDRWLEAYSAGRKT